MPIKSAGVSRIQILGVAQDVLRRRGSARIIEIASARGDVHTLLHEYRAYLGESEKQLEHDGVRLSGQAIELLRSEWSDTLIEHQQPPSRLRA
jgi:hypothetical protein